MRGAVSLAAALAIPPTIASGAAFPVRQLIIFLTFAVIVATLVLQGLTLAPTIRQLNLSEDVHVARELAIAHVAAADAGLRRLDELSTEGNLPPALVADLRAHLELTRHRYAPAAGGPSPPKTARLAVAREARRDVIAAERGAVVNLRDRGVIGDDVMRRVLRGLDLEGARLEQ